MYCLKCGKEIEDGSVYCIHCGARQSEKKFAPVRNKTAGEKLTGKTGNLFERVFKEKFFLVALLAIVIILLVVLVVLLVIYSGSKGSDQKADQKDVTGIEENTPKEESRVVSEGWQGDYIAAVGELDNAEWDRFSVFDINDDGTPEIVASGPGNGRIIMTWSPDKGVDMVTPKGEIVTCSTEAGAFCDTYEDSDGVHDVIYTVGKSGFEKKYDGYYKQDSVEAFTPDGDPNISYTVFDCKTSQLSYYDVLSNIFFSKKVYNVDQYATLDRDSLISGLEKDSPDMSSSEEEADTDRIWKYSFKEELQYFTAPYSGTYRFTLYGANGGADNVRDYDEEAATLCGDMTLKAGEKVIVITGGAGGICKDYYDMVNQIGYVAPGGYNGGGRSFSSGGGGGCTDIYYKGIRIAAAAGSGGGNYDVIGTKGRISGAKDKITSGKIGAGNDVLDAGGGGAGWFGGTQGKEGQCGYGGVNGWDESYFSKESESEGDAYTQSGSRDGSAIVEYLGN